MNMRKFLQMLLPLLLAGTMVLGMGACTPSTTEQPDEETNGSTESGTQPDAEDTTAADTPDVPDGEVVKAVREQLTFDAAVTIAEQDGGARVTHKDGLSYLASGYTSLAGNMGWISFEVVS